MGVSPPGWHAHVSDHDEPSSFDPRALTAEGTLVHAWRSRWSGAPGRPVLHDAASGWITSGEFDARSRSIAGALGERGAAAGVRVMLSGASSIDLVSVYIALLRLGAIVVPVNGARLVRAEGLEPPRPRPPEPKSGVSTNSTTPARPRLDGGLGTPASSSTPDAHGRQPPRRTALVRSERGRHLYLAEALLINRESGPWPREASAARSARGDPG